MGKGTNVVYKNCGTEFVRGKKVLKKPRKLGGILVAGVGFEPTTFRL